MYLSSFFFYVTATTEIYTYGHTLSLPDALPIWLPLRHREPALRLLVAHHAAARLRLRHGQPRAGAAQGAGGAERRSEEHTSELQSLMRISYAVFCLKKKT